MMNEEEIEISAPGTGPGGSSDQVEPNVDTSGTPPTETKETDEGIQLEPAKDEMERERLVSKLEQLQDEIANLYQDLALKEQELADVKKQLGITPLTELKQSVAHGFEVMGNKWKEMQETETFRKIDSKLSGWKQKVEGSDAYQKTVSTLNQGGKKVSDGFSSAGTKIKENETLKSMGEKTSSAFKRTGTVIKDTGSTVGSKISGAAATIKEKVWSSSTEETDGQVPDGNNPTKGETVIPDEPSKE